MSEHIYARTNQGSTFVVRTTARLEQSSVGEGTLTHVAAIGRLVVNAVVDATGAYRPHPVVDIIVHRDAGGIGYGVTTDSADDLIRAGEALIAAGKKLADAQDS